MMEFLPTKRDLAELCDSRAIEPLRKPHVDREDDVRKPAREVIAKDRELRVTDTDKAQPIRFPSFVRGSGAAQPGNSP